MRPIINTHASFCVLVQLTTLINQPIVVQYKVDLDHLQQSYNTICDVCVRVDEGWSVGLRMLLLLIVNAVGAILKRGFAGLASDFCVMLIVLICFAKLNSL